MLSVVIPSLGNDCVNKTIKSLNSGTILPDEIIVSLPSYKHSQSIIDTFDNVKIFSADQYGQVLQRIAGFKKAQYDYVLQLDDDITLDKRCIENLLYAIKKHELSAVSPYYMIDKRTSFHVSKKYGILWSLYYWIMNGSDGYQIGGIAKSGINFGVNKENININININVNTSLVEVEWQPGGCVLHEKKSLIIDNYFPFSGKAYSEDLMHSFLLRSSGVRLFTSLDAYCYISPDKSVDSLFGDFRARYHFVNMASLSAIRMLLFYVFYFINGILKNKL